MKSIMFFSIVLAILSGITSVHAEATLDFGSFGTVTIYQDTPHPKAVVLFVSGDGGWNKGVIDMARSLVSLEALVVGIDIRHYLGSLASSSGKCTSPATDFENLSKFVQKRIGIENYMVPILIGYSSGATLVYATLAQAPPGTFRGGISMGFCKDLPVTKPFCPGYGLKSLLTADGKAYDLLPTETLKVPWIAFQGTIDQVCSPTAVDTFVSQVNNATVVHVAQVGHGFSVQKNWLPQFREQFNRLLEHKDQPGERQDDNLDDLPLIELPADGDNNTLALIISGDGGWASIDRSLGESFTAQRIAVVGFNSLKYFWNAKTPEQSAIDLERIITHYLDRWNKRKVVLIGYSQGADVLPFMVNRLSPPVKEKVIGMALLGLASQASFEIKVSGWIEDTGGELKEIEPEIKKLDHLKILCLYGQEEKDSLCQQANQPVEQWIAIGLPGGHHFGGDYQTLAKLINTKLELVK